MSSLVVDTSAVAAIAFREPTRMWLIRTLAAASERAIAAPNVLELGMVLESRLADVEGAAARSLREAAVTVRPFTADLAERGIAAWRRFGKGRHPAGLNFGDCCTYALAEETGWPILCTGDDFARTGWPVLRPDPAEPADPGPTPLRS
jgi:ribonuclease VapC